MTRGLSTPDADRLPFQDFAAMSLAEFMELYLAERPDATQSYTRRLQQAVRELERFCGGTVRLDAMTNALLAEFESSLRHRVSRTPKPRQFVFPCPRKVPRMWVADWFARLRKMAGLSKGSSKWMRRSSATALEAVQPGAAVPFLGHKCADMAAKHYLDPRICRAAPPQPPPLIGSDPPPTTADARDALKSALNELATLGDDPEWEALFGPLIDDADAAQEEVSKWLLDRDVWRCPKCGGWAFGSICKPDEHGHMQIVNRVCNSDENGVCQSEPHASNKVCGWCGPPPDAVSSPPPTD